MLGFYGRSLHRHAHISSRLNTGCALRGVRVKMEIWQQLIACPDCSLVADYQLLVSHCSGRRQFEGSFATTLPDFFVSLISKLIASRVRGWWPSAAAPAHACFSAGTLRRPTCSIDAAEGGAIWCRIAADIDIGCFSGIRPKV